MSSSLKDVVERLDRLEAENRRLRSELDIHRVQSLYCHYINIGAVREIVGLFADRDDVEVELSNKGILRGRDAPHRYFLRAGSRHEVTGERAPQIPGNLVIHLAVNPALEVDVEGGRARAVWMSPGITNFPAGRDLAIVAAWCWGKYDIEYVREGGPDGPWKILAFRWRQIFLSRYDQGWVRENLEPGHVVAAPDAPSAPDFHAPYRPDAVNRFDPPPPPPFDTAP